MKGRVILIEPTTNNRPDCAVLLEDGVVQDILITPSDACAPGALFRGRIGRPMKGLGGAIVDLGTGQSGFLRQVKGMAPGDMLLVQVNTYAEAGKAVPVTPRLLFKSRYTIVTPGAPGLNISRSIREDEERVWLRDIAQPLMADHPMMGLILRTSAMGSDEAALRDDIAKTRDLAASVIADRDGPPELLVSAPSAEEQAWRDWPDPDLYEQRAGVFDDYDVWSQLDTLQTARVDLGHDAWMAVEPTQALVAIDVNTGGDTSQAAGLKANIAALRDIPRQLRLRGLGGQIVIDLAPMPKKERRQIETVLKASLRTCPIETQFIGWTPLGHIELTRKRERPALPKTLFS